MNKKQNIKDITVTNFKELIDKYKIFNDKVAFTYKQKGKIVNVTYKQFAEDIKALRNINSKFRSRKSSYHWR